jgi:hypothetical protein
VIWEKPVAFCRFCKVKALSPNGRRRVPSVKAAIKDGYVPHTKVQAKVRRDSKAGGLKPRRRPKACPTRRIGVLNEEIVCQIRNSFPI